MKRWLVCKCNTAILMAVQKEHIVKKLENALKYHATNTSRVLTIVLMNVILLSALMASIVQIIVQIWHSKL